MPRRLRLEFPGAIYHVMARGNGRQNIVRDDRDREHWLETLGRTVDVCGWEMFAFVLLSNHFHLFFRTPEPNLSAGMQRFLSGYAIWWSRRHRWSGHVFKGRFRAELIEDESYFWTVSRYIHLNPVRAKLVGHPRDWRWSSYPGYASRRHRLDWVAYDVLLAAFQGEHGGTDPAGDYRRFVTAGLNEPPPSPFESAWGGLVLGSQEFLADIKSRLLASPSPAEAVSRKRLAALDRQTVYNTVLKHYGKRPDDLSRRSSRGDSCRAVAAYLVRRWTDTTLRVLAGDLGLSRPDSVPNLTRRVERALKESPALRADLQRIEELLQAETAPRKTKNKV